MNIFYLWIHEIISIMLLVPFQKLDLNKDGVVTIEEFLDSCQRVSLYNDLNLFHLNYIMWLYILHKPFKDTLM